MLHPRRWGTRRRWLFVLVAALPVAALLLALHALTTAREAPTSRADIAARSGTAAPAAVQTASLAYLSLPLSFEPNLGQTADPVDFLSRGRGYVLFLTPGAAVLALHRPSDAGQSDAAQAGVALRIALVGAKPVLHAVGLDELPGKSNYLIGNDPTKWRTDVPNYARVLYKDVYPGIDLVYYGNQRQLEHDFIVAPGVDLGIVKFTLEGATGIRLDGASNLIVGVPGGEVVLKAPLIYQSAFGFKVPVAGSYLLDSKGTVGFAVGSYDVNRPLVIDPTLGYSTYLGGSSIEEGRAIAVDGSGNAYVTGYTDLFFTNFPTTGGAFDTTPSGATDVFVTKLNASGSALVYSTFLGGSSEDEGNSIAVDSSGQAYVTGLTKSSDFPTTGGAFDTTFGGAFDAFVAVLNASGTALVYSTFLGGASDDGGNGIAIDSTGRAYVAGQTKSSGFPTTGGAFDTTFGGGSFADGFVTVLNASGTALVYSTFLGGSSTDVARGIALGPDGHVHVAGITLSTNFPTKNAFQTHYGGTGAFSIAGDAFITRFNIAASGAASLVYSTYLGGSGGDHAYGIAVDESGLTYVTGQTDSSDFPTDAGGTNVGGFGDTDVIWVQLDTGRLSGFSSLLTSVAFGGAGSEQGNGIAVRATGFSAGIYIAGLTSSSDFPIEGSTFQGSFGGGSGCCDAFVVKIGAPLYSTYLGGSGDDRALGIAVDGSGNFYVVGRTDSSNFPTTAGAHDTTLGGGGFSDAFVAKFAAIALQPGTIQFITNELEAVAGFETAPTINVSVTRTGGSDGAVSVQFTTSNGTAIAGADYTSAAGTVNWANGDSAVKLISVTLLHDAVADEIEWFTVTLSNPTGGATLGPNTTTNALIADVPTPRVSGLVAVAGNGQVALSWNARPSAMKYQVFRASIPFTISEFFAGAIPDKALLFTAGTETSMTVTGLVNGRTYYFSVAEQVWNNGITNVNLGLLQVSATPAATPVATPTAIPALAWPGMVALAVALAVVSALSLRRWQGRKNRSQP